MRRKWTERIVIAIAALASIATSPPRWFVAATLPPPVPGKAMVVTIEASHDPEVSITDDRGGSRRLDPTDIEGAPQEPPAPPTPAARRRYFVPAGARLERVEIRGRCSVKLCSGKCKPPDGAYVQVTSAAAVDVWSAEDRSTPVTTVLDPARATPSYLVTIEASRRPIALEIDGAPGQLAPLVHPGVRSETTFTFDVAWYVSNGLTAPTTVTWTVRATIQGECAGAAGCAVPAGEAVRIVSVEAKAPDAP